MADVALIWDAKRGAADMALVDDDLATDAGLRTAMLLSLYCDRRAEDDDELPAADGDRRGWWGDEFLEVAGDRYGSRLWLLDRGKRTADLLPRAEEIAREAWAWLIEDRVVTRLDVTATGTGPLDLVITGTAYRPDGREVSFRFAHVWDGEAAAA